MNEKDRIQAVFEATGGIRDEYIEEAAESRAGRTWLGRIAAAAAVVALVIGCLALFRPEAGEDEPVPFFAIRAYALDGSAATLEAEGETIEMISGTCNLFPGKQTYSFEVSLQGYSGDLSDLEDGAFRFRHNGYYLFPGESDEELMIHWLRDNSGTVTGYRVTGWCDDFDIIEIHIYAQNDIEGVFGNVLHQLSLQIDREDSYRLSIRSSFTYQSGLTTDELIDQTLNQDYFFTLGLSSSPDSAYSALRGMYGGFAELEQRPDAATKLLERYERIVNGEEVYDSDTSGDYLVYLLLYQEEYWTMLTQQEQAHLHELSPEMFPLEREFCHNSLFGDHASFFYQLPVYTVDRDGNVSEEYFYDLSVSYNGTTDHGNGPDEHLLIGMFSTAMGLAGDGGYFIEGWFDEPTELTITLTDTEGSVRRTVVLLITPEGEEYTIEVLKDIS